MTYKIRIRRQFSPFWRNYYVTAHATEILGATARLTLTFVDGSKLAIPGIHKRYAFIYPTPRELPPL